MVPNYRNNDENDFSLTLFSLFHPIIAFVLLYGMVIQYFGGNKDEVYWIIAIAYFLWHLFL